MLNNLLFMVTIVLYFSMMLGFFKLFGRVGLYIWICIGIVLSNIEVIKMVEIFGLNVTLGNVIYSSTFLATDLLTEKYGVAVAKESVKIGFASLISFVVVTQLALLFVPNELDFAQEALLGIFSLTPRFCIAGIVTYFVSQKLDIWLYHLIKVKTGGQYLWLRNNVATLISQFVDTIVFTFLAFLGVLDFQELMVLILTSYVIKVIIGILDTPFLYVGRKLVPKEI
ncbi:MAG: queuosine precursor transporter [Eubacteriaceae bacterium]